MRKRIADPNLMVIPILNPKTDADTLASASVTPPFTLRRHQGYPSFGTIPGEGR